MPIITATKRFTVNWTKNISIYMWTAFRESNFLDWKRNNNNNIIITIRYIDFTFSRRYAWMMHAQKCVIPMIRSRKFNSIEIVRCDWLNLIRFFFFFLFKLQFTHSLMQTEVDVIWYRVVGEILDRQVNSKVLNGRRFVFQWSAQQTNKK